MLFWTTYSSGDLHFLGAAVKDLIEPQNEFPLNWRVLHLGPTALQTSEPHAHVTIDTIIEF